MPKYELDRDRENGSGIFYAYWRENGGRRRKSFKTKDEGEANKAFGLFLLANDPEQAAKERVEYTVADLWPTYMEHLESSGRTAPRAERIWRVFLKGFFGHLTVVQVTQLKIDEYKRLRMGGKLTGKRGIHVKETTVRNEVSLLLWCLNFCSAREHKRKMFDHDLIPAFDLPKGSKPRDRYLERHEIIALFHAARKMRRGPLISRLELFLYLALGTAAREEALYDLTYSRCRYDVRSIDLDDGERLEGDKKRAVVYMGDDLLALLQQAEAQSDQSIPRSQRLVLFNKSSIWYSLQMCVYHAGLAPAGWQPPKSKNEKPKATGISAHILRHTAATHMAIKGIPLFLIAKYLGNTLEMVEKTYAKYQPQHLKEAAEAVTLGLQPLTIEGTAVRQEPTKLLEQGVVTP